MGHSLIAWTLTSILTVISPPCQDHRARSKTANGTATSSANHLFSNNKARSKLSYSHSSVLRLQRHRMQIPPIPTMAHARSSPPAKTAVAVTNFRLSADSSTATE
jgi:hypothetical protein